MLPVADAQRFIDLEASLLQTIDFGIAVGEREQSLGALKEFFEQNLLDDDFSERHFRKHVNQFRKAGSDHAVKEVLKRLSVMPYAADIFAAYLRAFVHRTPGPPQDPYVSQGRVRTNVSLGARRVYFCTRRFPKGF